MNARTDLLDLLRRNNPFASNAAGDPRELRYPDVADLNRNVVEGIQDLIRQKDQEHGPLAATVFGEAGLGKTHLIGRLIDECGQKDVPYSFAYILPMVDQHQAFRYLLQEVASNLARPGTPSGHSQLDHLAARIFSKVILQVARRRGEKALLDFAGQFQDNPLNALNINIKNPAKKKNWVKYTHDFLWSCHPGLKPPEFVDVFLRYVFQPGERLLVVRWLKGWSLDEEELITLNVSDRSERDAETREAEARDIMASLDILLQGYGPPLVVFFDQLENLRQPEVVQKFQSLIWFLADMSRHMLPVVFFRWRDWQNRFEKSMDDYCRERLEANTFTLRGCTPSHARELIRLRLSSVWGDRKIPDELFPFAPEHLTLLEESIFKYPEIPPRQVITRANQLLKLILRDAPTSTAEPTTILGRALEGNRRQVLENFDQYDPDEGRLTLAAELYLRHRPPGYPYQVMELHATPEKIKFLDLEGRIGTHGGTETRVAFLIDVERHHKAVGASLKKGRDYLLATTGAKALYIREERCLFPAPPKWPATNELRASFLQQGGAVVILNQSQAAVWYALALLKFAIEAGDVADDQGRPLTMNEFRDFLATLTTEVFRQAFKPLDDYLASSAVSGTELPSRPIPDDRTPPPPERRTSAGTKIKPAAVTGDDPEAADLLRRLAATLKRWNLPVRPLNYVSGPRIIRLMFAPELDQRTSVRKIMNRAADLQVELGLAQIPLIQTQAGHLSLDAPRAITTPLTLKQVWLDGQGTRPRSAAAFPIGMAVDGTVVWADLGHPTMNSILVAGTAGSGKSIFLRSAVLGLALNAPPDRVRVILIDPKRVSFMDLAGLPHLEGQVITEVEAAQELLNRLVNEMNHRYDLFAESTAPDLEEYNRQNPILPRLVVVIDEYADLLTDKRSRTATEMAIQRLGQKGRAAGLHLILATQRPDSKVVTPLIKANLQLKVALKVTSGTNSQVVLDETGAERLMGHGDMLVGGAWPLLRLQGPIPSRTEIEAAKFSRKLG